MHVKIIPYRREWTTGRYGRVVLWYLGDYEALEARLSRRTGDD